MDGWLKALIACACAVVIIGGRYLAFAEYDAKYSSAARTNALLDQNRQTLDRLGAKNQRYPTQRQCRRSWQAPPVLGFRLLF